MVEKTSVFPKDCSEALALIYVQAQDLSGREPEDIAVLYDAAKRKIDTKMKEIENLQKPAVASINPPPAFPV